MRHKPSHSKKGYTFVEVLVASMLLVAVSVPMLKALTRSYVFFNSIRYKTQSAICAKSRLDRARAIAAGQYDTSLAETNTDMGGGFLCSVSDSGYAGDKRTISVASGYDKDDDGVLDAEEIEITLSSLIARR